MTLENFVNGLSGDKRLRLTVKLLRNAIQIWDDYAEGKEFEYTDSVAGLKHTVRKDMIINCVSAVERYLNSEENGITEEIMHLKKEFVEPVTALQDGDWNLPYSALKTFYSAYNLVNAVTLKEENVLGNSEIYVSINHAIDAIETSGLLTTEQIKQILKEAE
ncbi:MAG: hypothetical protein WCK13_08305 [Ignavibacteriota bacterium]